MKVVDLGHLDDTSANSEYCDLLNFSYAPSINRWHSLSLPQGLSTTFSSVQIQINILLYSVLNVHFSSYLNEYPSIAGFFVKYDSSSTKLVGILENCIEIVDVYKYKKKDFCNDTGK